MSSMISATLNHVRVRLREILRPLSLSPILVLGNQKTGTTAIAGLLAEHTGLTSTLDLPGMYEPTQTQLHDGSLSFDQFVARNRGDFARDIVKEPCLTFLYPQLRSRFPDSSIVFIIRDPRDNIRSILNRLSIPGDLTSLSENEFESLTPEWKLIVDGSWMGLSGENYIDLLADRWRRAATVYLKHRASVRLVRFEDFLEDKVGTIAILAADLGLDSVCDISDRVDVQYQPRGNRDVSWSEFFGDENLQRIEETCHPVMKEFGYSPSG